VFDFLFIQSSRTVIIIDIVILILFVLELLILNITIF